MNRKLATIIAAGMLTLSASSAFAALADRELIRVVYERNTGTTEQLTDLGTVSNLLSGSHTFAASSISANNANNLYVCYFAVDRATAKLWVSGSTSNAPSAAGSVGSSSLASRLDSVYSYYNSLTVNANGSITGQQSNSGSFMNQLNASLANTVNGNTSASLASLVNGTATSVTQTLYYIKDGTDGAIGTATITTSTSDTTIIATPIPPAFLLMGSGLIGMCGFRRRQTIAG